MNEIILRPAVKVFAEAMELYLRESDAIRSENWWRAESVHWLMPKLLSEIAELLHAIDYNPLPAVLHEATAIGVRAMMVYDQQAQP